ncbi:MAG TPA: glycoside hydrolase family 44 protein [Myxococcota bacterium]|nr:glycoside hydrolase family 44 protein [Myxococcota bacterium]HRY93268.1 glycoside hydrolase family 44 protein [Myxococcota bacterium]
MLSLTVFACDGGIEAGIRVALSPHEVELAPGATQQFAAAVAGTSDTQVLYSVEEAGGGTIDPDGLYTAPAAEGTFHVVAASHADPAVQDRATVTVAGQADPCDGVTCSGHGACQVDGGVAACQCDSGYHTQGLDCVSDADPCDGVTCSGHGACQVNGGVAACQCEAGFHAVGLTCVADADPCDGVTCSGHGACQVNGGVAACQCEAGFHAVGLTCVADADPCDGVTCSGHGACQVNGGVAACQCEAGFHAVGLTCVADDGTYITPDDPGGADVQVDVDSEHGRPISPRIYGHNGLGAAIFDGPGAPRLARQGGNRLSAYNWENNLSHAGTDWLNQNDGYMAMDLPADRQDVPGEAVRVATQRAFDAGADMLVTIQMLGYVATGASDGDVNGTANYLEVLFDPIQFRKGSPLSLSPDLGDGVVYMDELVNFLETTFPGAHQAGAPNLLYELDNEPDLWSGTHVRIHPDPATYAELEQKSIELAAVIKDLVPEALVLGPVSYGWYGFVTLQDAPDGGGRDFLEFFLDALATASAEQGRRLLDALDLHWYPEAMGGGVRITGEEASAQVVTARVQAPRSLWDPTYTEDSWISEYSTLGPIALIPLMQEKIAATYPGTGLAFTEYYYGGANHISGALAEADVLGIFGREGVFAAALWPMSGTLDFIHGGFKAFLDYDGAGGAFGDTSLQTLLADPQATAELERVTAYGSLDAGHPERLVIVAINKTGGALDAGFRVTHTQQLHTAQVYRVTAGSATPVRGADIPITLVNAFIDTLPAMSVTTLVLVP